MDSIKETKLLNFKFEKYVNKFEINNEIQKYFSNPILSDVPVALSLSGGVDSSIIFHKLLENKGTKFTNYSVQFENSPKYSQDHNVAEKISKKYGVKFNSVKVSSQDFIDNAEKIVDIVEEPTGNTNSISNYILSKNISEKFCFLVMVEMKYLLDIIDINQFI